MAEHAVAGRHSAPARAASADVGLQLWSAGRWVVAIVAVAVAGLIVCGYGMGLRWTGLSRAVTLWDWLQALLLPLALGLVPVLLRHRDGLRPRHAGLLAGGAVLLAGLVLAGYLVPLPWTGFAGHTLWDWFELALLPLVVTAAPIWVKANRIRREHLLLAAFGVLAFGAFVLAGYEVPLGWTGFSDNTAWDWLKLLLLPVLLPTVVIPLLTTVMQRMLTDAPATGEAALGESGEGVVRG